MPFYEKGDVRIHYQEVGSGFPLLVIPGGGLHPYAVAMECVHLAPNAQVSLCPWKDTPDEIPLAVRHIRTFLRAHRPVSAAPQPMAAAAQ